MFIAEILLFIVFTILAFVGFSWTVGLFVKEK